MKQKARTEGSLNVLSQPNLSTSSFPLDPNSAFSTISPQISAEIIAVLDFKRLQLEISAAEMDG